MRRQQFLFIFLKIVVSTLNQWLTHVTTPEAVCQMLTHRTLQSLSRCCSNILQSVPVFWDASRGKRLWFPSKGLSNRRPGFPLSQDGSKSGFPALLNPKKGAAVSSLSCLQSAHVLEGSEGLRQWTSVIIFTPTPWRRASGHGAEVHQCLFFCIRRKPICGKIKWDDTAGLADDWTTWRSNILPMFSSMYFQPNTAVDQLWTMN